MITTINCLNTKERKTKIIKNLNHLELYARSIIMYYQLIDQ